MSDRLIERKIALFRQRFGEPHFVFACHCAIPLALTPELAYRIWGTFQRDLDGEPIGAPWVAVSDVLLSPLCAEIGEDLYGMSGELRQKLIDLLTADRRFGQERAAEVAHLLNSSVRQQLNSDDVDDRDYAQAQVWAGEAQLQPAVAAADLALALQAAGRADRAEVIRLASVVEHLRKPFARQPELLAYARAHEAAARGAQQRAEAELRGRVDDRGRLTVAGISVEPPVTVELRASPGPAEPPPWRVGQRVAIAVGADASSSTHPLQFAEKDARTVSDVLRELGFSVEILAGDDAIMANVRSRITDVAAALDVDDIVVFYFGGHSARTEDGEFRLALNDTPVENTPRMMLPLSWVEQTLVRSQASRIVFLLDCPGQQVQSGTTPVNAGALAAIVRREVSISLLMPLASYESTHYGHGLFTHHLISGLKGGADVDGNGVITVEELADYLRSALAETSSTGPTDELVFASSGEPYPLVQTRPKSNRQRLSGISGRGTMSYSDAAIHEALLRIKNRDDSMQRHDNMVAGSLIRRRVRLIFMDKKRVRGREARPDLEPGDEGTVYTVWGDGTVVVIWDRGEGYDDRMVPGIDRWEWLGAPPPMRYPDGLIHEALLRRVNRDESMQHRDETLFEKLRGRRLRLVSTTDEDTDLEPGDEGWVTSVDSGGTVHVRWDRDVGPPGLVPGLDRWEWL